MTVEVSKVMAYAVLRPAKDEVTASKVTAYAVLQVSAPTGGPVAPMIVIIQ